MSKLCGITLTSPLDTTPVFLFKLKLLYTRDYCSGFTLEMLRKLFGCCSFAPHICQLHVVAFAPWLIGIGKLLTTGINRVGWCSC